MTISSWFLFGMGIVLVATFGIGAIVIYEDTRVTIASIVGMLLDIVGIYAGLSWYHTNTASGRRELIDQMSNLNNGLERTVTVYTADGNVIAQYEGCIDIEDNDGGYLIFDFEGKRYMYYNCFVEAIAEIP